MSLNKIVPKFVTLIILLTVAALFQGPAFSAVETGAGEDGGSGNPGKLLPRDAAAAARKAAAEGDYDSVNNILRKSGARWTAGKTRFTGMPSEMKKRFLGLRKPMDPRHALTRRSVNDVSKPMLPSSFDWRNNEGCWITPVKDQGPCGSCWAFAAVGQLESVIRIFTKSPDTPVDLSEQYMVSCDNLNWGCFGGSSPYTYLFMMEDGVPPEMCFPYVADDVSCSDACAYAEDISFVINDAWSVTEGTIDIEAIKTDMAGQPLYAGFLVFEDFMDYTGGIYQYSYGELLAGHAVLITGWDDADSCWIAKNSWGEGYGESGYFRIAYANGCEFGAETVGLSFYSGLHPLFGAEPRSGHAPLDVRFYDASVSPGGDPVVLREWSFSNGETAAGIRPTVTFDEPGDYGAVLTVTTQNGIVDSLHLGSFITVTDRVSSILRVPDDFGAISAAVDAAVDGDTIIVEAGTYSGSSNRNIDPAGKELVLIGEAGSESCVIDGSYTDRAFYIHNGEGPETVIQGFTIRNFHIAKGAGVFVSGSSPTLRDLQFDTCVAGSWLGGDGGGLLLLDSSPAIENMRITNCSADDYGGGMYISSSYPVIDDLTLSSSTASAGGGLFLKNGASVVLREATLSGNSATGSGGGFYAARKSKLSAEDAVFSNNIAAEGGGAGYLMSGSSYELTRCEITGNSAYEGGAFFMRTACRPKAVQAVFCENTATGSGGALYCELGSSPLFADCIIWDNQDGIVFNPADEPDTAVVAYSCVENGEGGVVLNGNGTLFWLEGNMDEDPELRSPWTGDFSLSSGSPCIDAGIQDTFFEYSPGDTLEVPVLPFIGTAPDMGAYEYNPLGSEDNPAPDPATGPLTLGNRPNPFNPKTTITFDLPETGRVKLGIYDLQGRLVKLLVEGDKEAGGHAVAWNGETASGSHAASGVYFYRLDTPGGSVSAKMVLLQ